MPPSQRRRHDRYVPSRPVLCLFNTCKGWWRWLLLLVHHMIPQGYPACRTMHAHAITEARYGPPFPNPHPSLPPTLTCIAHSGMPAYPPPCPPCAQPGDLALCRKTAAAPAESGWERMPCAGAPAGVSHCTAGSAGTGWHTLLHLHNFQQESLHYSVLIKGDPACGCCGVQTRCQRTPSKLVDTAALYVLLCGRCFSCCAAT